jgi:hypothetical protein
MSLENSPKNDVEDIQPSNEGFEQKMNDFGKLYKEFCEFVHKTIDTEYTQELTNLKSVYYFGKYLLPHLHEVSKCNTVYCTETNFKLFGDIRFTAVWEKLENKTEFWKFFHSMYVLAIGTNVLPSMLTVKLAKQLSDEKMVQAQANIDNYVEIVQNIISFRDSTPTSETPNLPFDSSFLEKSSIGQLAKEISSEIDTSQFENVKNPGELMSKLFSGGENGGLMSLMQNVTQKITSKMESGEIDSSKLMEEAQGMFSGEGGMPDLGALLGGGGGLAQMASMLGGEGGMPDLGALLGGGGGGGGLAQMASMLGGGFTDSNGKKVKSRKMKRRLKRKLKKNKKKKK